MYSMAEKGENLYKEISGREDYQAEFERRVFLEGNA
jgi:hypothetical protein